MRRVAALALKASSAIFRFTVSSVRLTFSPMLGVVELAMLFAAWPTF